MRIKLFGSLNTLPSPSRRFMRLRHNMGPEVLAVTTVTVTFGVDSPSSSHRIPATKATGSVLNSSLGALMDQLYSTIIFVPHARAKFRKLKVSHRLLISAFSLVP